MRKMIVIATREYLAAVRTKTFIISLIILPVMMSGSIVLQLLFQGLVDTADKRFVVVNYGAPPGLVDKIKEETKKYNETKVLDPATKKQVKPRFDIRYETPAGSPEERVQHRYELSEQAKAGKIVGFLEISPTKKPAAGKGAPAGTQARFRLRYQSDRPTYADFSRFVDSVVTEAVRAKLARESRLTDEQAKAILQPVVLESKGLSRRDAATGKITEASEQGRFAPIIVPIIMMMLMFMVVMMTATPLMQSVVEEKMQRIAEVLLGSARPFELMMGKLLGMMGVSLTISGVYLGGAYWAALHFHFAEYISIELLVWFIIFQTMAEFMFGSLFIAVGAACTDMKETQNLLWPIMLLVCLPLFLLGNIVREPDSPIIRGLSYFPFATPNLMIARLAIPPGIPWWEPVLGVVVVLISTIICVYAAGRIFRVGILMQGKGARIGEMVKWIFRG